MKGITRSLSTAAIAAALLWPVAASAAPDPAGDACLSTSTASGEVKARTGQRVRRNAAFALDLLARQAGSAQGNLALSPFGLSQVLAALEIGADGAMKAAIAQTLKLGRKRQAGAIEALRRDARLLAVIGQQPNAPFASADGLFVDQRLPLRPEVTERVQSEAGATVKPVDFNKPEAVEAVNRWVKERTNGRIETILEPGSSPSLAAVNAFAFKSCWRFRFDPKLTGIQPFTRLDGKSVGRPAMHLPDETLAHGLKGRFAAVELPYADGRFALTLVTTTDAPAAAAAFAPAGDLLAGIGLTPSPVRLTLPKFEQAGEQNLLATLSAMGLAPGLASKTQLDRFAPGLSLSAVKQKVFIRANEEGTEAAAATAAIVTRSALAGGPSLVRIERPFVYALRHRPTGTVLLVGYVGDPAAAPDGGTR